MLGNGAAGTGAVSRPRRRAAAGSAVAPYQQGAWGVEASDGLPAAAGAAAVESVSAESLALDEGERLGRLRDAIVLASL